MISLLLPSRGRPWQLRRMVESVLDHADFPEEVRFTVVVDNDDYSYDGLDFPYQVELIKAERQLLANYWNIAYSMSVVTNIYMICNDDVVFKTQGWDTQVEKAFEQYPDGIVLIYGDDGEPIPNKTHAALPFLHVNWITALGYVTPPYFSSDFVDTWLNEVADGIGRKVKVDILTEHMHPAYGKGEQDLTYGEKLVRHWKDDNIKIWEDTKDKRLEDIEKLKGVMK